MKKVSALAVVILMWGCGMQSNIPKTMDMGDVEYECMKGEPHKDHEGDCKRVVTTEKTTMEDEAAPEICTMEYDPVCGVDGVTYGNDCMAGKIEIANKGECSSVVTEPVIPDNCESWFDGCNNCRVGDGGMLACTRMFCAPDMMEEAKCTKFASDTTEEEVLEAPVMCTRQYDPVCGEDGVTYGNVCMAGKIPVSHAGPCAE